MENTKADAESPKTEENTELETPKSEENIEINTSKNEENADFKKPKNEENTEFKKPVLIGRVGKLPKKAKNDSEYGTEERKDYRPPEPPPEPDNKSSLPPAVLLKELSTPVPYKEPKWSGLCPDGSAYGLEVLKSGMIVETIDLTRKPYFVFGRLANCDVVMAHPTISRHHAVLQYKAFASDGEPPVGWYLHDLASTHGTFLNKDRLKQSHYTRVRVGHQIKFGASSRTYIVVGPDFDCEGESELTVTEIKQRAQEMKMERERQIKEAIEQRERDRLEEEKKREEQGIDWGLGEDAEDEPDLSENPYAATANEELYLEDPKKTLRGYFEREGHELTYDCEERGVGQFLCRVELPMDDARGNPVIAEVIHRGKKKEAVVSCALEACRILDRAGLLRQAKHESRRRKQRDYSADDYYSSDDDTFLDRTGSVERKRTKRMRKHGGKGEDAPKTYDDLLKDISEIEGKITAEEKALERLRAASQPAAQASEEDALDAFMSDLARGPSMAQKADISKTKMTIQKLKGELSKAQRLADIARPAHLPPLIKKDDKKLKTANSVVFGKRIRLKEDFEKKPRVPKEAKQEESEFVEEVESDEETAETNETADTGNNKKDRVEDKIHKANSEAKSHDSKTEDENAETSKASTKKSKMKDSGSSKSEADSKKMYGPMRPPDNYVIPENYFDQETDRDLPEIMEDDV